MGKEFKADIVLGIANTANIESEINALGKKMSSDWESAGNGKLEIKAEGAQQLQDRIDDIIASHKAMLNEFKKNGTELPKGFKLANADIKKMNALLQKAEKHVVKTGLASQNLVRIVQDAPFGMMGITNNLQELSMTMARMKSETNSWGAAMKGAFAGLLGPMAIPMVIAVVTGLILNWDKLAQGTTDLIDKFNGMTEAAIKLRQEIKNLNDAELVGVDLVKLMDPEDAINRIDDFKSAMILARHEQLTAEEKFINNLYHITDDEYKELHRLVEVSRDNAIQAEAEYNAVVILDEKKKKKERATAKINEWGERTDEQKKQDEKDLKEREKLAENRLKEEEKNRKEREAEAKRAKAEEESEKQAREAFRDKSIAAHFANERKAMAEQKRALLEIEKEYSDSVAEIELELQRDMLDRMKKGMAESGPTTIANLKTRLNAVAADVVSSVLTGVESGQSVGFAKTSAELKRSGITKNLFTETRASILASEDPNNPAKTMAELTALNAAIEAERIRHKKAIETINAEEVASDKAKRDAIIDATSQIAGDLSNVANTMFGEKKGFLIAGALLEATSASVSIFASVLRDSPLPGPLRIAAAAAASASVMATMMARIRAIKAITPETKDSSTAMGRGILATGAGSIGARRMADARAVNNSIGVSAPSDNSQQNEMRIVYNDGIAADIVEKGQRRLADERRM